MKNILLLGGSGSIGTQTIDVIDKYNSRFNLTGISVGNRTEILEELIKKYELEMKIVDIEYAFDNYSNYDIVDKNDFDLVIDDNKYYVNKSFSYPLTESEKDNVKVLASIDDSINSGKVGNINISLNNKTLKKIPLYIKEEKKKENFFTKLFS